MFFNLLLIANIVLMLVIIVLRFAKPVNKNPYDGQIVISVTESGKKLFSLELAGDPEDLEGKESVTFKIAQADIVSDE
jgi:hypothetical protein